MRLTRGGVVVALLLGTLALVASPAKGSWWDSLETPKEVSLGKVLDNPDSFLGVPVEFTVQFHETTKFYNPFFTRFTPDRYVNFAAWADEAALWMAEGKGNTCHASVATSGVGQRVGATEASLQ